MPTIETKEGCLAYEVHGHGEPVILLRGLGRTMRHWLGYERELAAAAQIQVITVELRGMGRSTLPCRWHTSLFDNADDVIKVLDHLNLPEAHVMGVSLGGMVALATGLRYPRRCRSLVVINASIAGQRRLRLAPRALLALGQIVRYRDERFHAGLVDVLTSPKTPALRKAEIARAYAQIGNEDGLEPVTVLKQLVGAGRFLVKKSLATLQPPTLVIYGADDQFVPNINSRLLATLLPKAELVEVPAAGHELSFDQPHALTELVRAWLGKNRRAAG